MILANYWKLLMNTVYDNETTSNTHNLVATDGTVFSDYTHRLVIDNSSESGRFNTSIIISGEYSWNNNPFTIREFGLYKNILYGTLASEVRRVLVAKSVLEEPIYMTKGSSFRIVADWIQS